MSRAFVNEDRLDDSGEAAPERIQSALPNYITPQGLEALSRKVEGLIAARDKASAIDDEEERRQQVTRIERDLRYFQTRLETALPVDPNQSADDHVHFGSEVKVIDAEGRERTYVIVGEDEADPQQRPGELGIASRAGAHERARGRGRDVSAPIGRRRA